MRILKGILLEIVIKAAVMLLLTLHIMIVLYAISDTPTSEMSRIISSQILWFVLPALLINIKAKCIDIAKPKWNTMRNLIAEVVLFRLAMGFVIDISNAMFENVVSATVEEVLMTEGILATTIVVTIVPAVCEEIMFRGIVIKCTRSGYWYTIISTSIIFAMLHGNMNQFVYSVLAGVYLGYIQMKYKNIIYTIICHLMFNACGLFVGILSIRSNNYALQLLAYGVGLVLFIRHIKKGAIKEIC